MIDLVSIIVPCYKQAQYLPEALDSVLSQSYQNWECIIVDDGSPDDTAKVAQKYCEKDNRFKYVFQENSGLSSARNSGIKNAIGEFILPLDSDDKMASSYVEKCVEIFNSDSSVKVVTCYGQYFGMKDSVFGTDEYKYENFIWRRFLFFCTTMFRKSDFDKTPGFNPNMKYGMEDFDFWLSIIGSNDKVVQIPEPLFFYRIKDISMNVSMQEHLKESYRQVVLNHLDVFSPYFERLFDYPFLEYKINRYEASKSYRIVKKIAKPLVWIRDFIHDK